MATTGTSVCARSISQSALGQVSSISMARLCPWSLAYASKRHAFLGKALPTLLELSVEEMNAKRLLSLPKVTSQVIYHASTQLSAGVTRTRLECIVHALLSILHQRTWAYMTRTHLWPL